MHAPLKRTHTSLPEHFTNKQQSLTAKNILSTPPVCSLKPGLPFGVRHPERGQLLRAAPDLRPCRVARVSRSSKRTSGFQTEFDRSKDRLPCCSDELAFPKGAGGKLHRHLATCMSSQTLHLALREGGADNCKTKRHHRLLLNVSTCKGFLKPEPANWRDRLARKPHRASPETTGCTQPIKFYCRVTVGQKLDAVRGWKQKNVVQTLINPR